MEEKIMQDVTTNLLQDVHKNSIMGIKAIEDILPQTEDEQLKKDLEKHLSHFRELEDNSEEQLRLNGIKPNGVDFGTSAMLWSSIKAKVLMNSDNTNIAKMMIEGSTMGIEEMTKQLHRCSQAGEEAKTLAKELISAEQKNIDLMKHYLQ